MEQLTFTPSEKGSKCTFQERKFGDKTLCINCGESMIFHTTATVEQVSIYISAIQMKLPASKIDYLDIHDDDDTQKGEIFIGGMNAALSEFVKKNNIETIVNCAKGLEEFFPAWAREVKIVREKIPTLRLEMIDSIDFPLSFQEMIKPAILFIHSSRENGKNCLVHCAQGVSRSGAILVAYTMALMKINTSQALIYVQKYRGGVKPNSGFWTSLNKFEKQIHELIC